MSQPFDKMSWEDYRLVFVREKKIVLNFSDQNLCCLTNNGVLQQLQIGTEIIEFESDIFKSDNTNLAKKNKSPHFNICMMFDSNIKGRIMYK